MHIQALDDLVSLSTAGPEDAQALATYLRRDPIWLEVVAGIDSVVVRFDAMAMEPNAARHRIDASLAAGVPQLPVSKALLDIPIVYGGDYGPDLEALCHELDLSEDEFISLHGGREYRVDMVGFTPGFAFVGGLDQRLHVPRRKEPRKRVPAGSVGIADGRTGLYALASPGGWTLIGRTPYPLFDPHADNPFPMQAGTRIRFVPASADVFDK
ncbi:MAG: 5-oxoprolinase subunit PxpB [Woeseiaceae bacterium]